MPIKKDLSNVPTAAVEEGNPPIADPIYAPLLAQRWAQEAMAEEEREFAIPGTRIRMSWSGKCARELGYLINKVEPSNPFDEATYWTFAMGSHVHEVFQAYMTEIFPNAEIEVKVDMRPSGLDASGHIDMIDVNGNKKRIAVEVKSINGFGFKMAVGARGPAQGPRLAAFTQGAMNALAHDADEMRVIYFSLENLSPAEMTKLGWSEPWKKFCAEWVYSRQEYTEIAQKEIKRMNKVLEFLDEGLLPPRQIPDEKIPPKARITDVNKGAWQLVEDGAVVEAGTTWHCLYCPYRDRCNSDGDS